MHARLFRVLGFERPSVFFFEPALRSDADMTGDAQRKARQVAGLDAHAFAGVAVCALARPRSAAMCARQRRNGPAISLVAHWRRFLDRHARPRLAIADPHRLGAWRSGVGAGVLALARRWLDPGHTRSRFGTLTTRTLSSRSRPYLRSVSSATVTCRCVAQTAMHSASNVGASPGCSA